MRMLLRMRVDTEVGNTAVPNGTIERVLKELIDKIKPEAAYFFADQGKRAASLVFDMADPSLIPALVEPLFQDLKAEVQLTPVMNLEDLQKGLSALDQEDRGSAFPME